MTVKESEPTTRKEYNRPHVKPYQQKEILEHLYHGERLSQQEIAQRYDVTQPTISRWIQYHGLQRRSTAGGASESIERTTESLPR